jgi:hypothetical protein
MFQSVFTYFYQRVPMVLFLVLATWFGVFMLPWIPWNVIIFSVGIVFMVLFQLRLFDDLMQYQNDLNKPNRDYTIPEVRKTLWIFWFVYSSGLMLLISWLNPRIGWVYLLLLFANWVAYKMLLNKWIWKNILPLLKYPIIYLVLFENYVVRNEISDNLTLVQYRVKTALLIFLGFIFLEWISDYSGPTVQNPRLMKFLGYGVLILICVIMVFVGFQMRLA